MPSVIALMALTVAATLLPSVPLLHWLGGLSPSLYALFIVGFVAASAAASGARFEPRPWRRFLLAMFGLGAVSIVVCRSRYTPLSSLNDFLLGPLFALLITQMVAGRLGGLRRALAGKLTVWLGDCSYSIYLIHAVVIEIVWRVAVAPVTTSPVLRLLMELVLGVGVSIVVGRTFYLLVERQFLHGSRRQTRLRSSRRRPQEVPA
jgi:peptidoglycan/LPS O-acetylase OafA/YrhL